MGRTSDHKDDSEEGPDDDDDGAHVAVALSSITRQPSMSSSAISSSSGASPGIYANVVTSASPWQSAVRYCIMHICPSKTSIKILLIALIRMNLNLVHQ